jgi:hypothetical protein
MNIARPLGVARISSILAISHRFGIVAMTSVVVGTHCTST